MQQEEIKDMQKELLHSQKVWCLSTEVAVIPIRSPQEGQEHGDGGDRDIFDRDDERP